MFSEEIDRERLRSIDASLRLLVFQAWMILISLACILGALVSG